MFGSGSYWLLYGADLTENWGTALETDEIASDARLLALGISLAVVLHDRLAQ